MMRWLWVLVMCLIWSPETTAASQVPTWEVGLRGGMDAGDLDEHYEAGEAYLLWTLPWQTNLAGGLLTARLDLGGGFLEAVGDKGGWLAGGADLVWQLANNMVEIEGGFRPTWLIDHIYGHDDFGGDLQFSSHCGIALHVAPIVFNYRYQHISNASIYDVNDGLDLHLFGIGYRF